MHPKYAKILNIAMFLIWQGSQNASFTQNSEYARRCLDRVLNILNMQLHMVTAVTKYAIFWPNMSE